MEWMLQVVDDIDDSAHALRFRAANFLGEIGLLGVGLLAVFALTAAAAVGADAEVMAVALATLGGAALLMLKARLQQPGVGA